MSAKPQRGEREEEREKKETVAAIWSWSFCITHQILNDTLKRHTKADLLAADL
jgi:hypothetical protein